MATQSKMQSFYNRRTVTIHTERPPVDGKDRVLVPDASGKKYTWVEVNQLLADYLVANGLTVTPINAAPANEPKAPEAPADEPRSRKSKKSSEESPVLEG